MLSDEEKKAIESFKEENNKDLSRFDDFNSYTQFKVKRDKLIIDLIEKQQKEIEELKRTENVYDMTLECYHDIEKKISNDELADKINEIIRYIKRKDKNND